MLTICNAILTKAPDWHRIRGTFALPFNSVLNWPMATKAGFAAFTNPKVNERFGKILNIWAEFLDSPASRYVLHSEERGWFSPEARESMPDFEETYICDPNAPYHGFRSWDDFFTRQFRPGVRPVERPLDDSYINVPCESSVYRISPNVKAHDQFWLKTQPYSLRDMFNFDPLVKDFIGGTVYQAYLSLTHYHRWHCPVNGRIHKAVVVPGSYFVESPAEGFENPAGADPWAPVRSQGFLTSVASRALIFIEADEPTIGLMCFVPVGMTDVSTCEITVKEGQIVKKGDELGMFHFGGSTYCMVFRPGTQIRFEGPQSETDISDVQKIDTVLGQVISRQLSTEEL